MFDLFQFFMRSGSCSGCAWSEARGGENGFINCVCPGNQLWFHQKFMDSDGLGDVLTWIASQCVHYAKGDSVMMGSWWLTDCPDCGQEIDLKVCQSQGGFYLGYRCSKCGPLSRVGGYLPGRDVANEVLEVARCTSSLAVVVEVV